MISLQDHVVKNHKGPPSCHLLQQYFFRNIHDSQDQKGPHSWPSSKKMHLVIICQMIIIKSVCGESAKICFTLQ